MLNVIGEITKMLKSPGETAKKVLSFLQDGIQALQKELKPDEDYSAVLFSIHNNELFAFMVSIQNKEDHAVMVRHIRKPINLTQAADKIPSTFISDLTKGKVDADYLKNIIHLQEPNNE